MAKHKQVQIEHEDQSADVDEGIAALVLALWRRGLLHTSSSCEEFSHGHGLAYIAFAPGAADEAERFRRVVGKTAQVVRISAEEEKEARAQGIEVVPAGTVSIHFAPSLIPALVEKLKNGGRLLMKKPGPSYHGRLPG